MDPLIGKMYGNKVRVRVSGLCWRNDELLVVKHDGLGSGHLWAPPGGGLEFQEPVVQRLKQEFLEETGFEISVQKFRFACEYIHYPLHAVELFFDVSITGGKLTKGNDPEMAIIQDVRFMSWESLSQIPSANLHGIFRQAATLQELRALNGFFSI